MADPMKIRATLQGEMVEIRVLMSHPMETGQRKDPKTNQNVPAHFIQNVKCSIGGKVVLEGQLNTAVSRNPVFGFRVKGAKVGDKVTITWTDNKGETRTDEVAIAAG
jgi:sulfur-oxidizing protein SoxZ